jgi:predicted phage tail protein
MPLSEQEQRLLEEMERSLYQNDADFVATTARRGAPNYTVLAVGVLVAVLGVATLVAGVITQLLFLGIIGFVIMFGGVLLAVAPPGRASADEPVEPAQGKRATTSRRFMDSLNDRWDKRQDERE